MYFTSESWISSTRLQRSNLASNKLQCSVSEKTCWQHLLDQLKKVNQVAIAKAEKTTAQHWRNI
jgi:hypothetical protein